MNISRNHEILEQLSSFLEDKRLKKLVQLAKMQVLNELSLGTQSFSVSITPNQIPELIFPHYGQLIRVYGAKQGTKGVIERHPNSFQSLTTAHGEGRTKVYGAHNGFEEKINKNSYWSFVPENIWHRPIAEKGDWVAITFHSASAEDLIDEYRG